MNQFQTPQPVYPSFSLAMASINQYPLRLPAYRSSYLNRHHPYPRVKRPMDLMHTIDRRFMDDEVDWILDESLTRPRNDHLDLDDAATLLHTALNPTVSLEDNMHGRTRASFTALVIDLSLAFRHGCRRVLSAARTSKSSLSKSQNDDLQN